VYQGRWPYVRTAARNWYEIQLSFGMSVVLLDFQLWSEPIWWSVALQGYISDTQFLNNKSLFGPSNHLTNFGRGVFQHPVYSIYFFSLFSTYATHFTTSLILPQLLLNFHNIPYTFIRILFLRTHT
jgi:hypothetical protein